MRSEVTENLEKVFVQQGGTFRIKNGSTAGSKIMQGKFEVRRKTHKEVHMEGSLKGHTEAQSKVCMEVYIIKY